MPNFANPFQGNVNRKLTKEELIQAVRLDIAGELEAIYLYDAHVQATDDGQKWLFPIFVTKKKPMSVS